MKTLEEDERLNLQNV